MSDRNEPGSGFLKFELARSLQRAIAAAGFIDPRPIQDQTIPEALEGRDVLGLAQTGTGKTAAFALPLLQRLVSGPQGKMRQPRVLIVAPTRELASQIGEEIGRLAKYTNVEVATIFGGVTAHRQIVAMKRNPEIIVACPGRLLDLMKQGEVKLDKIEVLVLDEADHMFDMGFLPDVQRILAALPMRRQNLLFSATMPREIRRLAQGLLHQPHVVDIDHRTPLGTIEHALYPIQDKQRIGLLQRILSEDGFVSAIVFTRTKHRAKRLAQQLDKAGHRAVALQGNMSQNARVRAMEGFRKKEFDVLVATDIAARGLDVEQVSHVVNFDMPNTPEAYTHRIGRTGRAERAGRAYTFVTDEDRGMIIQVERRLGASIPRRSVEGVEILPFSTARGPRNAQGARHGGGPGGQSKRRPVHRPKRRTGEAAASGNGRRRRARA